MKSKLPPMKHYEYRSITVPWRGRFVSGCVVIKRKKFCSVSWSIDGLDCVFRLEQEFLTGDDGDLERRNDAWKDWKTDPNTSRSAYIQGGLKWGNAKGVSYETAIQIANAVVHYWNIKINLYLDAPNEF